MILGGEPHPLNPLQTRRANKWPHKQQRKNNTSALNNRLSTTLRVPLKQRPNLQVNINPTPVPVPNLHLPMNPSYPLLRNVIHGVQHTRDPRTATHVSQPTLISSRPVGEEVPGKLANG